MCTSILIGLTLLPTFLTAIGYNEQCKAGFAGLKCNMPCPTQCTTCDRLSQECTLHCVEQHRFGKLCENICPHFCDGRCNIITGACSRCSPTFGGTFCNISCPTNCRSTCDMNTMECHQCKPGFTGTFCNAPCPNTTELSNLCSEPCPDEGRYGDDCDKPCPGNCTDGCYRETGECVNCTEGFGGRFCDESCPENCFNGCDRYRGICNYCQSRYHGQKCSKICPTNCKEECHQNDGHCLECKSGFQGKMCNEKCPKHCNGGCNQTTGACNTCATGFMGHYCNNSCENNCEDGCEQITGECMECQSGFTGLFCEETCSRYCRDECEQTSGECIGCIDGYTGTVCNETCPSDCLGGCDQYTRECGPDSEHVKTLKIAIGVTASLFCIMLVVVIVKRGQLCINRNQREYLNAIPESNINRESSSAAHRYYDIEDINLVNDHGLSTAAARSNNLPARDVRLPPPLPRQRKPPRRPALDDNLRLSSSPPSQIDAPDGHQLQDEVDPQLPPPLPCQGDPPPHDDVTFQLPPVLSCKRDATKPSYPRRVNHHFHCDNIFENEIYESVDEAVLLEVGINLPLFEGKEEQDLLEEEAEHLKYSVAVGGVPSPGNTHPEAPAVTAVDTHAVTEYAEVSGDKVDDEPSVVVDASGGQNQTVGK